MFLFLGVKLPRCLIITIEAKIFTVSNLIFVISIADDGYDRQMPHRYKT